MSLQYHIAIFTYQKANPDELSLAVGDILETNRVADDGWGYCTKVKSTITNMGLAETDAVGSTGWVPMNFTFQPKRFDVDQALNTPPRIAIILYDYNPVNVHNELTLKKDEVVTVLDTIEEPGWCRGVLQGRMGVFPESFARIMSRKEFGLFFRYECLLVIFEKENFGKPMSKRGVAGVKIQAAERRQSLYMGGVVQELQQQQQQKAFNSNVAAVRSPPQQYAPVASGEEHKYALVMFDYAAQQPDELNLKKGNRIIITKKDADGWWTGTDEQGITGVFPYNFVKEIMATSSVSPNLGATPKKLQPYKSTQMKSTRSNEVGNNYDDQTGLKRSESGPSLSHSDGNLQRSESSQALQQQIVQRQGSNHRLDQQQTAQALQSSSRQGSNHRLDQQQQPSQPQGMQKQGSSHRLDQQQQPSQPQGMQKQSSSHRMDQQQQAAAPTSFDYLALMNMPDSATVSVKLLKQCLNELRADLLKQIK